MAVYPLFVEVSGRRVVVVGGGPVGRRKAAGLAEAGAEVVVVDPEPRDELLALAAPGRGIGLIPRRFEDGDCRGALLVFACTGDPATDAAVARAAHAAAALCCRADAGEGSDFSSAALLRRGDLCVAVSTSGTNPSLAATTRDRIASLLAAGPEGPCTR